MTTVLQAQNISYQFENGDILFENISVSLTKRRVGLIGHNGAGKSILASLLTQARPPSQGQIILNATVASYEQITSNLDDDLTIAQYLNIDHILEAITQIESGVSDQKWFDLVGDQWTIEEEVRQELAKLHLPADVTFPCGALSGGQVALLRLSQLFKRKAGLLVLDEPSNHLDETGKNWLIHQINQYHGHIFLISHDRQLLREMEQIWELSELGLIQYGGNYDFYIHEKTQESLAIERQIHSLSKQQQQLEEKAQKNKEKAAQRAAKGHKMRQEGGQSKIILDTMRNNATAAASNRLKNDNNRRKQLQQRLQTLQERQVHLSAQHMSFATGACRNKKILTITEGLLPFGSRERLNLQVDSGMKLHLHGPNGSGKSTLLKIICNQESFCQGEMHLNTNVYYLDQQFSFLHEHLSLLENLMLFCTGILETDARTLLAGIGVRRDHVYRLVSQLSGGEKMKLSILITSHQPENPLLLLDEPDNHLDLNSKKLLATSLSQYKGSFILVSHEQDFIKDCNVTCTFSLKK